MKICVFGLRHLGCVTAACVAEHFPVIGFDPDVQIIADLKQGTPPVLEPGLQELIRAGELSGRLQFTDDIARAIEQADFVWVAFDTPVDEDDQADAVFVEAQISSTFPYLKDGSVVLVSSQLPVGSTGKVEQQYRREYPGREVYFAYSPDNLRFGESIESFRKPGRIVVGSRMPECRLGLETLLMAFCQELIWMSVESAEMTKHAVNAFLANSIVFINEIAALCEQVGADAKEVEEGLRSEERIGPRAYLGAGGPFAGGTLARDVAYLVQRAQQLGLPVPLLKAIKRSNDLHKNWARQKLQAACGALAGKTVAILGLTYKPGTDTLGRSVALELCDWLVCQGVKVQAFDPVVRRLPEKLRDRMVLCDSALAALKASDAAVVATEWPQFRELTTVDLIENMKTPVVVDASRFLEKSLECGPPLVYFAVGMPRRCACN